MCHKLIPFAVFLAGMACLFATACKDPANPCVQALLDRDRALAAQADSLLQKRREMSPETYRDAVQHLHTEEQRLFAEVENCDFGKDLSAYNYWYRGRLKFPGKIGREWQRLELESAQK